MSSKMPFDKLPRIERVEIVRDMMAAGHSNRTAARQLGVKRGMIAGIKRDFNIPSNYRPGFADVAKSSSGALLRLSINEACQCAARTNGHQCAFERVEGSDYCGRSEHQALDKRRR